MKYLHYQLHIGKHEIIQATLQQQSHLRILDDENYVLYRQGDQYRYHGGVATGSPAVIKPPEPGEWHLVIDLGGVDGEVVATVHVIKEASEEKSAKKKKKRGFF